MLSVSGKVSPTLLCARPVSKRMNEGRREVFSKLSDLDLEGTFEVTAWSAEYSHWERTRCLHFSVNSKIWMSG